MSPCHSGVIFNLVRCVCDSSAHQGSIHKELFVRWVIILGFVLLYGHFLQEIFKNGFGLAPTGLKQPSVACLCPPSQSLGWGQKLSAHLCLTKQRMNGEIRKTRLHSLMHRCMFGRDMKGFLKVGNMQIS